MNIVSENLRKYVINMLTLEDEKEIKLDDINKIKELNLNRLNYNLEEAIFIPDELAYFTELEKCSFDGFLITDEIRRNLKKLKKLKVIELNHCILSGNTMIDIEIQKLYLNYSNFNFINIFSNKTKLKELLLKNISVDGELLSKLDNLENLSLLNCNVKNSEYLNKIIRLKKIRIIGSKLDNEDIIKDLKTKIEVEFSEKEFRYIF